MSVRDVGGSPGGIPPEEQTSKGSKRKREEKSTGSLKAQRGPDGAKIEKKIEETVETTLSKDAEKGTKRKLEKVEDQGVSSKKRRREQEHTVEQEYTVLNAPATPYDVLEEIFSYLDKGSVASLALTEKSNQSLVNSSRVVQKSFLDEFIDEQLTKAKNLASNTIVLIDIAKTEAKMGYLEKAKETLNELKKQAHLVHDNFNKSLKLIEVAKEESEIGATEEANKTLATVEELIPSIQNAHSKSSVLIEVAKTKILLGALKEAKEHLATVEELVPSIQDNSLKGLTRRNIVKTLAQIGSITKNKEILAHTKELSLLISSHFLKPQALINVAKAENEIGATEEAKETLLQAKEVALLLTTSLSKCATLIDVAEAQFEVGAIKEAIETLTQAKEQALSDPQALIIVLTAQIELGLLGKNKEILLLAKETALLIGTPIRQYEAFIKIATAENKIGATEEARKTLVELEKLISHLSPRILSQILPKIVEVQVAINGLEASRKTLAKVKEDIFLPENIANRYQNLTKIAGIQIKIGDLEEAKKTLLQVKETALLMKDTHTTFKALIKIAIDESKIDAIEEAIETLAKAEELEQNPTNFTDLVEAKVAIAEAQIKRGDLEKASETLAKARENISHINPLIQFPALMKVVKAENTIQAIEAKTEARKGNIVAVRKYLEESSSKKEKLFEDYTSPEGMYFRIRNHMDIVQEALELGSIAFQAMRS